MAKLLSSRSKNVDTQQKEKLKSTARDNTTVSKGTVKNGYSTVKSGSPLDHETKQKSSKHKEDSSLGQAIGMSKGCTKNMDNYESLRVDCWLSDSVREGETVKEAFNRIEAIIDEVLEESVLATIGEDY